MSGKVYAVAGRRKGQPTPKGTWVQAVSGRRDRGHGSAVMGVCEKQLDKNGQYTKTVYRVIVHKRGIGEAPERHKTLL